MKLALTLALAATFATPLWAGAAQAQALAGAQATTPKVRWSVETTPIADLAADPAAKALVAKHFPNLFGHPAYEMIKTMPLKAIAPYSQGVINDQSLAALQADFDALP